MGNSWIFAIGFIAQGLFSARLLVQWIKSERSGRVLSPTLFWQLSIVASFLLIIYGVLRNDIVIISGQIISYFIYIGNLKLKKAWVSIPAWFRAVAFGAPAICMLYIFQDSTGFQKILSNPEIPISLMLLGYFGQLLFTLRFIYQWFYSAKAEISVLPPGFWIISLSGSVVIIVYAIFRKDPVLIAGHFFGSAIYMRNLYLHFFKTPKTDAG